MDGALVVEAPVEGGRVVDPTGLRQLLLNAKVGAELWTRQPTSSVTSTAIRVKRKVRCKRWVLTSARGKMQDRITQIIVLS